MNGEIGLFDALESDDEELRNVSSLNWITAGIEPPPLIWNDGLETYCGLCKQVASTQDLLNMVVCEGPCGLIFHPVCVNHISGTLFVCLFCQLNLITCRVCSKAGNERQIAHCQFPKCRVNLCFPSCVESSCCVFPTAELSVTYEKIFGHVEGLYDDEGRLRFICPAHFCSICKKIGSSRAAVLRNLPKLAPDLYAAHIASVKNLVSSKHLQRCGSEPTDRLCGPYETLQCRDCLNSFCKLCVPPDTTFDNLGAVLCGDCIHKKKEIGECERFSTEAESLDELLEVLNSKWGTSRSVNRTSAEIGVSPIQPLDTLPQETENDEEECSSPPSNLPFTTIKHNVTPKSAEPLMRAPTDHLAQKCQCSTTCADTCVNAIQRIQCNKKNCNVGEPNCKNRPFAGSSSFHQRVEVLNTKRKGKGLYAKRRIEAGSFVVEYVGEVVPAKEHSERVAKRCAQEIEEKQTAHWYSMEVTPEVYLDSTDMGSVSRFANHSCEPNCEALIWSVNGVLRVGIFSISTIELGDEITYDYRFERTGMAVGFRCECGTKKCRGIIGSRQSRMTSLELCESYETHMRDPVGCLLEIRKLMSKSNMAEINQGKNCHSIIQQNNLIHKKQNKLPSTNAYIDSLTTLDDFNVAPLLAAAIILNGQTLSEWLACKTRKIGTDIPWAWLAVELSKLHMESLEEGAVMNEFIYSIGRRYLYRRILTNSRKHATENCAERLENLLDMTWGCDDWCERCGGDGTLRCCDFCGAAFHASSSCMSWESALSQPEKSVCSVCCFSSHRCVWMLRSNGETRGRWSELVRSHRLKRFVKKKTIVKPEKNENIVATYDSIMSRIINLGTKLKRKNVIQTPKQTGDALMATDIKTNVYKYGEFWYDEVQI